MASLADHSVDALISDPPYGTTALSWDKSIDWPRFWALATRVCTENAVIVLFAAQPFATDLINSNRRLFRYELIWHKRMAVGWLDARRRPLRAHENILIFARRLHSSTYNPQMETGHKPYARVAKPIQSGAPHYGQLRKFTSGSQGERYPRSVLSYSNRHEKSLHPTQKPLPLLEWLVNTYSQVGDVVLDPFMGSGTTGIACINTGRRFIGVEKDQDYFDVARVRMEKATTADGFGAK
ncbi:modification methylase DpnIIB [Abditibacteriota bacterium]|nr:modification methylase DpnIIB [Abditibacteriota bacterium]